MPKIVDHAQRRDEIALVACRVVAVHGFDGASMVRIAREAGYTTGMLAHYFDSKQDIISAALRLILRRIDERLRRPAEGAAGPDLLDLLTPWTAINLVDFYVVRRGHYSIREIFNPAGLYGRWNWRGLTAYLVGFLVMVPFFSTTIYTGPVARALGGADIAMLVGLPVAAGIYLLACRSLDLEREWRRVRVADVGLEPNEPADAQAA